MRLSRTIAVTVAALIGLAGLLLALILAAIGNYIANRRSA